MPPQSANITLGEKSRVTNKIECAFQSTSQHLTASIYLFLKSTMEIQEPCVKYVQC